MIHPDHHMWARWPVPRLMWAASVLSLIFLPVVAAEPNQAADAQPGLNAFNTERLSVALDQIVCGGPPKDGIPSLTSPPTVPSLDAGFMGPRDRVVGVTVAGQSRAYPIKILNWHEVINDELANTPIAVIYCPLCDSVSVVDRRLGSRVLEFGVSGLLHNSNVLLFDRSDHALWSQVGLTAISGPHAGRSLNHLPFEIVRFETWTTRHPRSTVVSSETGYRRRYAENPYTNYFNDHRLRFPVHHTDRRLRPKTPVIGVKVADTTRAYPVSAIQRAANGRLEDTIGGQTIVLIRDAPSGRVAIETSPQAPEGQAPEPAMFVHSFWFAWSAFHPNTEVYSPD